MGFSLSGKDVPKVKQRIGIGNALTEAGADDVLDMLDGGCVIELDNGWRLAASRVAREQVIELMLCGITAHKDEVRGYGFFDETIRHKRRWFTHLANAAEVIDRLITRRKPVRDVTVGCSAA